MVQLKLSLVQLVAQAGYKAVAGVESLGTQQGTRITPASLSVRPPMPAVEPTRTDSDNPGPSGFDPDGHRAGRPASTGSARSRCLPRTALRRTSGPRAKQLARGPRVRFGPVTRWHRGTYTTCRMPVA